MHYKNGRLAKAGDTVVLLAVTPLLGILHSTNAQSTTCNGRLAQTSNADPYINIKDCLHIDDVTAADVPDISAPKISVSVPPTVDNSPPEDIGTMGKTPDTGNTPLTDEQQPVADSGFASRMPNLKEPPTQ